MIQHGTYGGLQQCKKRPEGTCAECRKAGAEYMRERRKNRPELRSLEALQQKAGDLARQELAKKYLLEYRELYAKYKKQLLIERKQRQQ